MDLINHKSNPLVALAYHDKAAKYLGSCALFPFLALVYPEQFGQGKANQQFTTDIRNAEQCTVPAMWK
ncbi:hypothetical protein X758_18230 [Mesorhizobium sp. LSHC416B00]|nr:hypothetical protein X761_23560 [Mesorhizobium sp. LSHC424B00]ESX69910.1 hypothetical protein X758_18230 [Mesorhizobium sp. LSHC416B00]